MVILKYPVQQEYISKFSMCKLREIYLKSPNKLLYVESLYSNALQMMLAGFEINSAEDSVMIWFAVIK